MSARGKKWKMSVGKVESARQWVERVAEVGRKIMIHSGQIPSPFLADKVLDRVAGNVYRETWKEPKRTGEEGNTCGGGGEMEGKRCVALSVSGKRGKSLAAAYGIV